MDSAADSLLALSNTAVALAEEEEEEAEQDDDRSSSLSELDDDAPDAIDSEAAGQLSGVEGDSEAETERLEESPDKANKKKGFGSTPSKLAQATHVDERPEIESLTESQISSPISSDDSDNLSDAPGDEDEAIENIYTDRSTSKRKREDDEQDEEEQERTRRRRTGSIASEDAKSDVESDAADDQSQPSREATLEPDGQVDAPEEDVEDEGDEQDEDEQKADSNEDVKENDVPARGRSSRRRGKEDVEVEDEQEAEDEAEAGEESEEAEAEADDAEAAARSEEEQAKRMAAMDALTSLERHFAVLRDRLYDERIAQINHELAQLAETVPSHPELLRQLEAVRKFRDEKFEVEQKLLVYKIGALKTKSIAERSQIYSEYYQKVRDIREKHLERASEHFYRIQRDRFKSDAAVPSFAIPYPEKRSKRITQQTAYNKEVSILSGMAKYVGFPAAPELAQSHAKEMEDDMQKMGISSTQIRASRAPRMTNTFDATISAQAAEEQFLEKNAWANPQHPMHRLNLTAQNTSGSSVNETFLTPAPQQRTAEAATIGSASTILEPPSAPASSNLNTPHDVLMGQNKANVPNGVLNQRVDSVSEESQPDVTMQTQESTQDPGSSPLAARAGVHASPSRPSILGADGITSHPASSPPHQIRPPGITAGYGGGRYGLS